MAVPPQRARPLILRVVSRMAIGGVQRGILATLARADRDAFDYALLCTKKEGKWAPEVRALGVPVYFQKTIPPWSPFQILRLARVMRRIAPDLVHVHMAPMVIPAATAARLAGVPRVVIQHHNDYANHWNSLNGLLRAWEFCLTRHADAVFGVSQAVARRTEELVGLPAGHVEVTYNGLELDKFINATPHDPRAEWGLAPGMPLVVHVARYLNTKRIEDFIEAASLVLAHWREIDSAGPAPAFCVIGGGAEEYQQRYAALIEKLGLRGRVILAGSRDDVPNILRAAQLGALASEMEGFGQVLLEYTAAGLPVAATNLACIAELLRHDREALLSPPRRPEQLADNMLRLLRDKPLADRLHAAAKLRLQLFDWQTSVDQYEAIYRRLLASPARR